MNSLSFCSFITACALFVVSCEQAPPQAATTEAAKPDLTAIRAEIQEVENAWAAAMNNKDVNALMALYADDAISMQNDAPSLTGKAAIQKQTETDFAKNTAQKTYSFETMEVYAMGDHVLEIGKSISKDSTGAVTGGGKYMALFEKQNGKYVCTREIYNNDQKEK